MNVKQYDNEEEDVFMKIKCLGHAVKAMPQYGSQVMNPKKKKIYPRTYIALL